MWSTLSLPDPKLPLIIGQSDCGRRRERGRRFRSRQSRRRAVLGWTDGVCRYCTTDTRPLRSRAVHRLHDRRRLRRVCVADARYCFALPEGYTSEEAAPLLCGGLIGFRAFRMAGDAEKIGFYGFGSSAQMLAQVARAEGREVFAFTRDGGPSRPGFRPHDGGGLGGRVE